MNECVTCMVKWFLTKFLRPVNEERFFLTNGTGKTG